MGPLIPGGVHLWPSRTSGYPGVHNNCWHLDSTMREPRVLIRPTGKPPGRETVSLPVSRNLRLVPQRGWISLVRMPPPVPGRAMAGCESKPFLSSHLISFSRPGHTPADRPMAPGLSLTVPPGPLLSPPQADGRTTSPAPWRAQVPQAFCWCRSPGSPTCIRSMDCDDPKVEMMMPAHSQTPGHLLLPLLTFSGAHRLLGESSVSPPQMHTTYWTHFLGFKHPQKPIHLRLRHQRPHRRTLAGACRHRGTHCRSR